MIEGFFKAELRAELGASSALATLRNGRITGGDSVIYFVGTYSDQDGAFFADLQTDRYAPGAGMISVFGREPVRIELVGAIHGDVIQADGHAPDSPGVEFSARLTRLA